MPTDKETPKNEHLLRILDAASELFLELGFEQTSTAKIAARAKLSKRELYTQFADKRGILSACISNLQKEMFAEMNVEWSSDDDVRSVLRHAGDRILKLVLSEKFRNVFRIVATESYGDREAARQFYNLGPHAGRHQTAKYFAKQIKKGVLIQADPLQAADDFLDLVITARLMTSVALGNVRRLNLSKNHVAHAVDLFLNYYSKPDSTDSKAAMPPRIETKKNRLRRP